MGFGRGNGGFKIFDNETKEKTITPVWPSLDPKMIIRRIQPKSIKLTKKLLRNILSTWFKWLNNLTYFSEITRKFVEHELHTPSPCTDLARETSAFYRRWQSWRWCSCPPFGCRICWCCTRQTNPAPPPRGTSAITCGWSGRAAGSCLACWGGTFGAVVV